MKPPAGDVAAHDDLRDVDRRLNELLKEYGSFLRSAVRRVCPTSLGVTVEEIEQDARIRLWHALSQERNITDPASYLYRIAATSAIDAMRRVRARRESPLEVPAGAGVEAPVGRLAGPASPLRSPEAYAADREVGAQIRETFARLPENRRRAVGLHLRGFNSTEIGRLLGWSEPKARNLLYRGLEDLRALLRAQGLDLETDR